MTDCTLTLAANRPGAALFVVQPQIAARNAQPVDGVSSPSAVIRARDSLLRSGGEGAAVATGRKVDIQLTNVLVSTEGSLVHAVGDARSGRADSPSVKVRLDQVTALVKGGLVHLDGTKNPDEPELPFTAIEAENSILSTANRDVPLFRLDRNDQGDDIIDKIHWAGRKVAYDRIQTYRRDEVHQTAVAPKIYNRADWSTAFLPTDESPILGDVKFVRETDPSHSAWKIDRDDFKLAPGSPIAATGPDLGRIPAPPAGELWLNLSRAIPEKGITGNLRRSEKRYLQSLPSIISTKRFCPGHPIAGQEGAWILAEADPLAQRGMEPLTVRPAVPGQTFGSSSRSGGQSIACLGETVTIASRGPEIRDRPRRAQAEGRGRTSRATRTASELASISSVDRLKRQGPIEHEKTRSVRLVSIPIAHRPGRLFAQDGRIRQVDGPSRRKPHWPETTCGSSRHRQVGSSPEPRNRRVR